MNEFIITHINDMELVLLIAIVCLGAWVAYRSGRSQGHDDCKDNHFPENH